MMLDLFAGAGGWEEGASQLGIRNTVGIEWDEVACATARAAGHHRISGDVAGLGADLLPRLSGLIASPPCQSFSRAGKGLGKLDAPYCIELADRMSVGFDALGWREWADDRSPLVAQPVRWVRDLRPRWIALEQVQEVLPFWRHLAGIFEGWGYFTWTGVLNAADYGVPQTRKRAFLIASLEREVHAPQPTHAKGGAGGLLPWVTMAAALGWDVWDCVAPARGAGITERHGSRPPTPAVRPSPTVTTKARSWDRWVFDRPTTVAGDPRIAEPKYRKGNERQHASSIRMTVQELAVLQSFRPGYPWRGSRTRQCVQVGNAVPPLLAARVLEVVV